MTVLEVILIGIVLAIDAFSLTIANCTTYNGKLCKRQELSMPIAFGFFQFLMPVIGYYVGSVFSGYISAFSGYLTALVFLALAIKIVIDNLKKEEENTDCSSKFTFGVLIIQAIATSIDALLIGVTFALKLEFSILIAGAIIGVVTFIIVLIALVIGKTLGKLLGKYAEWCGAIILFALSIKNLLTQIL